MNECGHDEDQLALPLHNKQAIGFTCLKGEVCVNSSDNDLLEAIAEGDRAAFAILMRRYLSKMVVLAHRIIFDREQAREIAQEAFLRVWKHASKWDPTGSATFATWLHRVVVNLAISQRRRYREQISLDTIVDLPDVQPDGFDHIAAAHQKRLVENALRKLPDRQRTAIVLYYYEDLSQTEAANVMQLTPKAFDSLLVRARGNFKKYLATMNFLQRKDIP